jgi:hypothetical protein
MMGLSSLFIQRLFVDVPTRKYKLMGPSLRIDVDSLLLCTSVANVGGEQFFPGKLKHTSVWITISGGPQSHLISQ